MNRVTDAIRGRIAGMLDRHLPERTKRLLFLASFSGQLKDPGEFSDETLHKLNKMLDLSTDDAALRLPVHLSHAIWRNRPLEAGLRLSLKADHAQEGVHALSTKVLEAMPKWLRYGDEPRMRREIEKLLCNWQHVGA
jgi:hypothetical protein